MDSTFINFTDFIGWFFLFSGALIVFLFLLSVFTLIFLKLLKWFGDSVARIRKG